MNKSDIIEEMVAKTNMTKTAAGTALDAALTTIAKGVKRGPVQLIGFGTLRMVETAARVGVNPQDPTKKIKIPAKKVMKFKVSKKPKY